MGRGRKALAAVCAALAALCAALVAVSWHHPSTAKCGGRAGAPTAQALSVESCGLDGTLCKTNGPALNPQPSTSTSRRGTAPVVLVTKGRVTGKLRHRAVECGARVTGVMPPDRIIVEADMDALSRLRADDAFAAAEPMVAADKMSPALKEAVGGGGGVEVTVVPVRGEDAGVIAGHLVSRGVRPEEVSAKGRGRVCVSVPAEMVVELASRCDVRWVERCIRPRPLNNVVVQPGLMNIEPMRTVEGLDGSGQTVTISDSGLDTGDPSTVMDDFKGRIAFIGTAEGCLGYDKTGHGTHVAGSLAGDGSLSGGAFKGVAYGAALNVWQCGASNDRLYPPECDELFQPDRANSPSYIHSGSWGGGEFSAYDSQCVEVDGWMWRHPENLAVFAAGNYGTERSICSPAGAKNVIAVGATESLRPEWKKPADNPSSITSTSSMGPMADGRIKPDVCAPGSYVLSTRSTRTTYTGKGLCPTNSNYMFDSGTSMATPLVSGSAALVRQWLMERRGYTNELPTAALMKAVLMGGAHDMAGDADANCGGAAPNSSQGWGRIDLGETLYPADAEVKLVDRIPFEDGETFAVRVTTTNAAPLAVQLVWTDYPGEYGAVQDLVNDLDLVVSNETTGAVWYGNGTDGGDRTNNAESVRIALADAGAYSVMVRGVSVPYGCMEGGAAALYVRGAFGKEDATNAAETVQLTVAADGDVSGYTIPSLGVHRVTKGVPVFLEAEDIAFAPEGDTITHVRKIAGWTGTGDVPASGEGGRVAVRLEQDSGIVWRWNGFTNVLLRSYLLIPSYGNYYWTYEDAWPRLGETVALTVPGSVPGGSETVDLSSEGWSYTDEDGRRKALTVQKLGRIEVAETDADAGTPMVDENGYMVTEFSVMMDNSRDMLYYFYDVASTNVATTLPMWWYQRYVAENPASNVVRFTAVSPKRLEWVGGAGHTRVLERTPTLGPEADWKPVFTNAPAPALTNVWEVPAAFSTNSFYRIVGQ